ncbi:hypothetical protein [Micromonospora sp. WMMD980]|uniref:hypothetical protein n=1 Tax=Micromonospora sp. WMMD980 TaxID=3016088 RepID=UPI002416885F|nr:hypothetical protein [Micromonospora sp. WMMD980]MDG4800728.1 hypothetical protein [Micromonospora sp. WMMD980]
MDRDVVEQPDVPAAVGDADEDSWWMWPRRCRSRTRRAVVGSLSSWMRRRGIADHADAYPTLTASGHLDDTRWSDDLLFEEGLTALLRVGTSD